MPTQSVRKQQAWKTKAWGLTSALPTLAFALLLAMLDSTFYQAFKSS